MTDCCRDVTGGISGRGGGSVGEGCGRDEGGGGCTIRVVVMEELVLPGGSSERREQNVCSKLSDT